MIFNKEADFEAALIKILSEKGWEKNVLKNYSEEDLLRNWADILFENNRDIDRLNDYPLTNGEMQQILEQIVTLKTPVKLNGFINGKSVTIIRDNPDDKVHFGKEVSLKIYDRREIAAGQSRYQIVQQPKFRTESDILNNRRGDLLLLINGMPVIHIELKKTGIPVSQAYHQIEKYSREGAFTGIFSLVQIFVAMEPNETVYFANPGPEGKFNPDFYFHWADFNNEPINEWSKVASTLLSIPMAHQLIGFYTVADTSDGVLKVMRSYQYYAASAISDKVAKAKWEGNNQLGGYIWHTTGSGKTMTSFKAAQLIASSKDADKVVFLVDRIELGTQSLKEYRGFADETESVQATENTNVLISKLKSTNPSDTLIVTSIQKMSNIKSEDASLSARDIELINNKRIVFIVDEAHRSTFGDMLITIKDTFQNAMFFGFTGTPIHEENQKMKNTTSTVFGDELHRYSIADGIRDKNVLGFDPYKVLTFKDRDLRKCVALDKARAKTELEAISDPRKSKVYYKYMDPSKIGMVGSYNKSGKYIKGIEDYIPNSQYTTEEHVKTVIKDIEENWLTLSRNSKFHAIFATNSISEAIVYYRLFKEMMPSLKVTALFDPNIDNNGDSEFKEDGLEEIINDYNLRYGQIFTISTFYKMKKEIAARLAHKTPFKRIENEPDKQIDLLIVVDQMLTGFDSKWVNTLYMDKILRYENIIQAFSRTNRLFGPEKPFGTIRYYRRPHTMEQAINDAVKLYSGDKEFGLFVCHLVENLKRVNRLFESISDIFDSAGIVNFEKLPADIEARKKFAKDFNELNGYLEAAKIQGFKWDTLTYVDKSIDETVQVLLDEKTYLILVLRYKELIGKGEGLVDDNVPYDLVGYITEIDTGLIDSDYMNSRFDKYIKLLRTEGTSPDDIERAMNELHKTFATLTQEEQKYANIFLHDIQRGDVEIVPGKTLRDYINEYGFNLKKQQIKDLCWFLGLDETLLLNLMDLNLNENNLNEFGRYDDLKKTIDTEKARKYFEVIEGKTIISPKVLIKADKLLREFILSGGIDIEIPVELK
ncbi:type I site-specific deoxyribonuclease, HsdR family [Veillonella dispar ATCC 17748]|uniref:Type I restriction enzyme endonuclease subunit n=1 Tax=Veillonella dispar ATCC 17748 TaxID=546273 RepID=C4FN08_9FIRM|nr:HsdR family type I site-specific deoxyribonuclease [Veillonella dispar]EEP66100.1 type I site-specific deoxyribonuclease, HsdR family [Veillonella dispar ATCC 17748]VEG94427.1 Type-1 restriction enzyme R protein [Veillonella dispar]